MQRTVIYSESPTQMHSYLWSDNRRLMQAGVVVQTHSVRHKCTREHTPKLVYSHASTERRTCTYIHTCAHRGSVHSNMHAMPLYTHVHTNAHVNTCSHKYRLACGKETNTLTHRKLGFPTIFLTKPRFSDAHQPTICFHTATY